MKTTPAAQTGTRNERDAKRATVIRWEAVVETTPRAVARIRPLFFFKENTSATGPPAREPVASNLMP